MVVSITGCDDDEKAKPLPANNGGGPNTEDCKDEDGDGFGAGCFKGLDCDDSSADSTNECYRCQTPNEGCPCDTEGKVVECGHEASRVGDRVTCVMGERTCHDGEWGSCSATTMTTQQLAPGQLDLLAVAQNPTPCTANLCDPFCKRFDASTTPSVDSVTTVGPGGVTLVATGGGSGPSTGSSCGTQTANAVRNPLGILAMVQRSRNMTGGTLTSIKTALNNFFQASTAAGMVAGLDVFPCVGCTNNNPISSPTSNTCLPGTDASMCCGFQYTGPIPSPGYLTVPMATLPGTGNAQRTAMTNGINGITAVGSGFGADSPMLPALQGALNAAGQWAATVPNAKPVVLLVTDGLPDACGSCGGKKGKSAKNKNACRVQEVVQAVETAFFGTPSVTTLVIGVNSGRGDNLKYMDTIARSGSGGKYGAFIVNNPSTTTELTAAVNRIRDEALSCTFAIPPPSGSNIIDPATAVVTLSGTNVPRVTSPGACGTNNGFYYEAGGPSLVLCPTTCTTAKNDLTANIQISYGCKTGCASGSSRATPGPLDLLFMIDRSSAMAAELKDSSGNNSGVTAWQAMQNTLRNFSRSADSAGIGMAVSYFPPPASAGQRCLTCKYCQDNWGTQNCDCKACILPPLADLCWCGETTDVNLKEPVPWPYCPEPRNAGVLGDCINNATGATAYGASDLSYEYLQGDSASCLTSAYTINAANGGVDFGVLPNGSPPSTPPHWQQVFNSLGRILPISMPGSTPAAPIQRPLPALQSAISQASARLSATGRKQAVVLVTSGMPATAINAPTANHNCGSNSASVTAAAAAGWTAGIPTYVIGVGSGATAVRLDPIAAAGQGNSSAKAYIFSDTSDPSAFITAMNTIRKQAASCAFDIPVPASGQLNYTATEVRLTSGTPATEQLLTKIDGSSTCAATQSWFYNNNTAPTNLNLCTTPCNTVRNDLNSRVDLVYQCVPPAPTYSVGVATFEFDATGACGPDEVPVWGDFSWTASLPGNSKVSFAVATGNRDSGGTISNLSAEVPLKFTKTGALLNQTACAASWASGPASSCGFTVDTHAAGPQYANSPGDVYVDKTLAQASLLRTQNYLRIRATLTPSTDFLSPPTIAGWDLQVSCKAAR